MKKKSNANYHATSLTVLNSDYEKLNKHASENGTSVSFIIRRLIRKFLEELTTIGFK